MGEREEKMGRWGGRKAEAYRASKKGNVGTNTHGKSLDGRGWKKREEKGGREENGNDQSEEKICEADEKRAVDRRGGDGS